MRCDMDISSSRHSWYSSGSERTVLTMFAPCLGGFEYKLQMRMSSCDITAFTASCDPHVIENVPTRSPYNPKFLAKD